MQPRRRPADQRPRHEYRRKLNQLIQTDSGRRRRRNQVTFPSSSKLQIRRPVIACQKETKNSHRLPQSARSRQSACRKLYMKRLYREEEGERFFVRVLSTHCPFSLSLPHIQAGTFASRSWARSFRHPRPESAPHPQETCAIIHEIVDDALRQEQVRRVPRGARSARKLCGKMDVQVCACEY